MFIKQNELNAVVDDLDRNFFTSSVYRNILDMISTVDVIRAELMDELARIVFAKSTSYRVPRWQWNAPYLRSASTDNVSGPDGYVDPRPRFPRSPSVGTASVGYAISKGAPKYGNYRSFMWLVTPVFLGQRFDGANSDQAGVLWLLRRYPDLARLKAEAPTPDARTWNAIASDVQKMIAGRGSPSVLQWYSQWNTPRYFSTIVLQEMAFSSRRISEALMNVRSISLDLKARIRNIEWELNRVHLPMVDDLRAWVTEIDIHIRKLPTNAGRLDHGVIRAYEVALSLNKLKSWIKIMREKIKARAASDTTAIAKREQHKIAAAAAEAVAKAKREQKKIAAAAKLEQEKIVVAAKKVTIDNSASKVVQTKSGKGALIVTGTVVALLTFLQ